MADTTKPAGTETTPRAPLSDGDFETFMATGEFPNGAEAADAADPALADTPAEAAAAEADVQPASRDAKPGAAPEAAQSDPKPKQPGQKKTAKEKSDEVARENEELQERLRIRRELRRELDALDRAPKAETTPAEAAAADAKKDPAWKKYREHPDFPKSADYESLDDWQAAAASFVAEQIADARFEARIKDYDANRAASEDFGRELNEQMSSAFDRAKAEQAADPEIVSRIDPRWVRVETKHPSDPSCTPIEFVKGYVALHARRPLALAAYFSTPEGIQELGRLATTRMSKGDIVRELHYLDARMGDLPKADEDGTDSERAAVQPSRVSKAPAPAKVLGKKPAPGVDPVTRAIEANDFEEFNRLETAAGR